MAGIHEELQRAIYSALKASTELSDIIYDVYDDVSVADELESDGAPYGEQQGYVSFGPESTAPDNYECVEVAETTIQIDAWSRQVGRLHCKAICAAVKAALHGVEIELETHPSVVPRMFLQRIMPDPDESITHGAMQFTIHIEEGD